MNVHTVRTSNTAREESGGFRRSIAVLAGGSAFGQIAAVVSSPILTRMFGPADFGALAVYTAVISLVGSLAALSYHQAIPLPESDAEAGNVLSISVLLTLLISALMALIVAVGGETLVLLLDAPQISAYLWMIPAGVLGLGIYEVLTKWSVRKKRFGRIARTSVTQRLAQVGTQIGLGIVGAAPFGLLFGQLVGQWVGTGALARPLFRQDRSAFSEFKLASVRAVAYRYRKFPQYNAPAVVLNTLGTQAPSLLLSYFFGGAVTGLFALSSRILLMPVHMVSKSASQVFFSTAAEANRQGRLASDTLRMFSSMVRISVPLAVPIAISAPGLFSIVFGNEWYEAGIYVRWLTPWLSLVFVTFPLSPLTSVLERQRAGLIVQAMLVAVRVLGLVIGGVLKSPLLAISLFSIGSAASMAGYLMWLLRISGASIMSALRIIGRVTLMSIVISLPVIAVTLADAKPWYIVLALSASVVAAGVHLLGHRFVRSRV